VGGFLGGILFSAAETLPTMSCVLLNHLPVLTHVFDHFLEDLDAYTRCLRHVLGLESKDLLFYALRSWIDLSLGLKHMLKSAKPDLSAALRTPLSVITELWESSTALMHYDFTCPCGSYEVDIGSHIKESHTKVDGPE